MWYPAEFLAKMVPGMLRILGSTDTLSAQKEYIKTLDKEFTSYVPYHLAHPLYSLTAYDSRVKNYYLQVSKWMVRMESNLTNRAELWDILMTRNSLFTQVCIRINFLLITYVWNIGIGFSFPHWESFQNFRRSSHKTRCGNDSYPRSPFVSVQWIVKSKEF